MRQRKLSFEELVAKNKQELLNDKQAMKQIEEQMEKRQANQSKVKYAN
ncbi:FbpB family small basic protein [Aquibacillus kalidii]|nr:FbpB family small basic protein [Aquibacillus kalidii]